MTAIWVYRCSCAVDALPPSTCASFTTGKTTKKAVPQSSSVIVSMSAGQTFSRQRANEPWLRKDDNNRASTFWSSRGAPLLATDHASMPSVWRKIHEPPKHFDIHDATLDILRALLLYTTHIRTFLLLTHARFIATRHAAAPPIAGGSGGSKILLCSFLTDPVNLQQTAISPSKVSPRSSPSPSTTKPRNTDKKASNEDGDRSDIERPWTRAFPSVAPRHIGVTVTVAVAVARACVLRLQGPLRRQRVLPGLSRRQRRETVGRCPALRHVRRVVQPRSRRSSERVVVGGGVSGSTRKSGRDFFGRWTRSRGSERRARSVALGLVLGDRLQGRRRFRRAIVGVLHDVVERKQCVKWRGERGGGGRVQPKNRQRGDAKFRTACTDVPPASWRTPSSKYHCSLPLSLCLLLSCLTLQYVYCALPPENGHKRTVQKSLKKKNNASPRERPPPALLAAMPPPDQT